MLKLLKMLKTLELALCKTSKNTKNGLLGPENHGNEIRLFWHLPEWLLIFRIIMLKMLKNHGFRDFHEIGQQTMPGKC